MLAQTILCTMNCSNSPFHDARPKTDRRDRLSGKVDFLPGTRGSVMLDHQSPKHRSHRCRHGSQPTGYSWIGDERKRAEIARNPCKNQSRSVGLRDSKSLDLSPARGLSALMMQRGKGILMYSASERSTMPANKPRGRPSKFQQKLADGICQRLTQGEPYVKICQDTHMPNFSTICRWEQSNPDFGRQAQVALEHGTHFLADDRWAQPSRSETYPPRWPLSF